MSHLCKVDLPIPQASALDFMDPPCPIVYKHAATLKRVLGWSRPTRARSVHAGCLPRRRQAFSLRAAILSEGRCEPKGDISINFTSLSNAPMDIRKFCLYVCSSLPLGPPRRYPEMEEPLHFPRHRGTVRRGGFSCSEAAESKSRFAMALRCLFSMRRLTMPICTCRACRRT